MTAPANSGSRETVRDQASGTHWSLNVQDDTVGVVDFVASNERIGKIPVKLSSVSYTHLTLPTKA